MAVGSVPYNATMKLREAFEQALRNLDGDRDGEAPATEQGTSQAAAGVGPDSSRVVLKTAAHRPENSGARRFASPAFSRIVAVQPMHPDSVRPSVQARRNPESKSESGVPHPISTKPGGTIQTVPVSTAAVLDATLVSVAMAHAFAGAQPLNAQPVHAKAVPAQSKNPFFAVPLRSSIEPRQQTVAPGRTVAEPQQAGSQPDAAARPEKFSREVTPPPSAALVSAPEPVFHSRQSMAASTEPAYLPVQPQPVRTAAEVRMSGKQPPNPHDPQQATSQTRASNAALPAPAQPVSSPSVPEMSASVDVKTNPTASGSVAAAPIPETFAALDHPGQGLTPVWTHAGPRQAEAGYQDRELGWVAVRAQVSPDGIHAAVVPGSAAAAQALAGHLAGLNTHLAEQHTPIAGLTLSATENRGAGSAMGQSGGPPNGQGGHGSSQHSEISHAADPIRRSVSSSADHEESSVLSPGALSGGTYVSVMA